MSIDDPFSSFSRSPIAPGQRHASVTPSDGDDLPFVSRLIYVGTGGAMVAVDRSGAAVSYKVQDGTMLAMQVVRIRATGTDASDIVVID